MGGVFACRNCGALLTGRYCADCGQKHKVGMPTVGHLLAESVEGLTHADSRLWRTLRVLLHAASPAPGSHAPSSALFHTRGSRP